MDDAIHLLQKVRPSNERHGRDVRCHTRPFAEHDIAVVNGLRTTSLERTIADCAMMLRYRQALILTDHALRLGADQPPCRPWQMPSTAGGGSGHSAASSRPIHGQNLPVKP